MKTITYVATGTALLVLAGIGGWLWWSQSGPSPTLSLEQSPTTPPVTPAPGAAASAPEIRYPIEAEASAESAVGGPDLESTLAALFGRKTVLTLFQLGDFPRRVAATVDNLGRAQAPARLWPLNPADGRFTVERRGDAAVIGAGNGSRYAPYVALIETVDLQQAVAAYKRMYPQFQRAYEELGYPKRYFNDRLIAVIDQLLATPDPTEPIMVRLPAIKGPEQPRRPWVLYEFADPTLQSLSAGQKILLRMGPGNAHRVKARLTELRRLLAGGAPAGLGQSKP